MVGQDARRSNGKLSREPERATTHVPGQGSARSSAGGAALAPGKRTLTESLAPPGSQAAPGPSVQSCGEPGAPAPTDGMSGASSGPQPTMVMLFGGRAAGPAAEDPSSVHAAAARGIATASSELPHGSTLQRAFGRHDVSGIQAHAGADAAASARQIGARAYATGDHVVLGDGADLHTVAHEAAHVVQQRGGVQLKSGVSEAGDAYERHADAVADAVVRGQSAEALLDGMTGGGASPAAGDAIQRIQITTDHIAPAVKVAQQFPRVHEWLETMVGLSDPLKYPVLQRHFGWLDIDTLRGDYKATLAQLQATASAGDVAQRVHGGGQTVDETGYAFKDHSGEGTLAHSEGHGADALITFFQEAVEGPSDKLALTIVHELTHAAPQLKTKDIAYRHDLLYESLGGLLSGLSRQNADTYATALAEVLGVPHDATPHGDNGVALGTFRVEPANHQAAPIILDIMKAKYGIMRRMNDAFTKAVMKGDPLDMLRDWISANPAQRAQLETGPRMERYNHFNLVTGSQLPTLSTTAHVQNDVLQGWGDQLLFAQALKNVDFAGMVAYLTGSNARKILYAGEWRPIDWLLQPGTIKDMFTIWYAGKPLLWQMVSFFATIDGLATEDNIPVVMLPPL